VDDTAAESSDDVVRSTWEGNIDTATPRICDRVAEIANEVAIPKGELKYMKVEFRSRGNPSA
jgi:5,10-methenyltetrahydromethanopterin hydrogenase